MVEDGEEKIGVCVLETIIWKITKKRGNFVTNNLCIVSFLLFFFSGR